MSTPRALCLRWGLKSLITSRARSLFSRPSWSSSPRRGTCSRRTWKEFPRNVTGPSDICPCQRLPSPPWRRPHTTGQTRTPPPLSLKQVGPSIQQTIRPSSSLMNFKWLNIQPISTTIKVRELKEQSQTVNVEIQREVSSYTIELHSCRYCESVGW